MNVLFLLNALWFLWSICPCPSSATVSELEWADYVLNGSRSLSDSLLTTEPSFANASSPNLSAVGSIRCFANPPLPGHPPYQRINPNDYYKVLELIVSSDQAVHPVTRSFNPGQHRKVVWGRCAVTYGLPFSEPGETTSPARVTFREIEMAHVAAKIAGVCLHNPGSNALGGYTRYGPSPELHVALGTLRTGPRLTET